MGNGSLGFLGMTSATIAISRMVYFSFTRLESQTILFMPGS